MKDLRNQLRNIRTNVMQILADVVELQENVAKDPDVGPPTIKKAVRGAGGRFVKKS